MHEPRLTLPTLKVLNAVLGACGREVSGADIAQVMSIASGTLYPILLRLERAGWLESRWEDVAPSEVGRPRRRLYSITPQGRARAVTALQELEPARRFSWAR